MINIARQFSYFLYINLDQIDLLMIKRQRGGMVTQRIANPCIPVRFRALPPKKSVVLALKKSKF